MDRYIYLLVPHWIEVWDEKLEALVDKYDSPYTGSIVFIVLVIIMFAAIKSSNK